MCGSMPITWTIRIAGRISSGRSWIISPIGTSRRRTSACSANLAATSRSLAGGQQSRDGGLRQHEHFVLADEVLRALGQRLEVGDEEREIGRLQGQPRELALQHGDVIADRVEIRGVLRAHWSCLLLDAAPWPRSAGRLPSTGRRLKRGGDAASSRRLEGNSGQMLVGRELFHADLDDAARAEAKLA